MAVSWVVGRSLLKVGRVPAGQPDLESFLHINVSFTIRSAEEQSAYKERDYATHGVLTTLGGEFRLGSGDKLRTRLCCLT